MPLDHLNRRAFAVALGGLALSPHVRAQGGAPLRLIVPYAAGGPVDTQTRTLAPVLQGLLNETVIVENRPGAGSMIGARAVATAPKDGKTVLVGNSSTFAIAPATTKNAGYDPVRSFVPLGVIANIWNALVVNPAFAGGSVQDLMAAARANPGKVAYASAGVGNGAHLIGELLASAGKVEMTHVPYRSGAESLTAVVGGQVQFAAADLTAALPLIRDGKLKALAVINPTRSVELPNVPTIAEAGFPTVTLTYWTGAALPAGTPPETAARLEDALRRAVASPEYQAVIKRAGAEAKPSSGKEMAALIASDFKRFGDVARRAGIQLE